MERPREVEEGVTRVEDVGALGPRPQAGHVGALPVRPQLGAVLQRQPVVAVVQHQHRRPEDKQFYSYECDIKIVSLTRYVRKYLNLSPRDSR